MSIIATLKTVDVQRNNGLDKALQKRHKLIKRLDEQLLLEADGAHEFKGFKWIKNSNNVDQKVPYRRRVRKWWFEQNGVCYLTLYNGTKKLELVDGKTTIEVGERKKLKALLTQIKKAVEQGELDKLLDDEPRIKNTQSIAQ